MSEIWSWTARETVGHIRSGELSAREVAEAALGRIAAVEPRVNALSEVTDGIALAAAEAVDRARLRGEPLGPLAGVPITIKNNVDQAGTRNTGGIIASKDNLCAEDSPLVANLKASGAVIVGRTNVPAFSFRWSTDTDLHGRTLNPHGANLSPGGSSGGAGAALAAGIGALAHGNDIGGSIRHPAHVNGVVGLRPTVGRVPSFVPSGGGLRAMTSQMITADGPMARSVADLAVGVNAMALQDPRDPQQVPIPPVVPCDLPERIGLVRASDLGAPAPEVDAALSRAAGVLEQAGCSVEEITLPRFADACRIWEKLVLHATRYHYLSGIRACGDRALIHNIETVMAMTEEVTADEIAEAWAQRLQIMRDWSEMFVATPVVVMPVSYRHALKIDADQGDADALRRLFDDQAPLLSTALLGHPGLAVPTGFAADGAPTGVQLAARWWDEGSLLSAGQVIEDALGSITPVTPT